MKALIPLILLAGCASWPAGSYVDLTNDSDAATLAPAIAECVSYMIPLRTAIALVEPRGDNALSSLLTDELHHQAVIVQPDGRAVSYVAATLDQGMFVSVVSPPHARCGQYFSRETGRLKPAGSMMVMQ